MKVWLPRDAAARALGADDVAGTLLTQARARGIDLTLIRNGSRGMIWLEPLLEIETPEGRIGFGPVTPADVAAILDTPEAHPKALGLVEALPWMARQTRLTFARCGVIDPLSLADYEAHGGLSGLRRALEMDAAGIVAGRGFRPASNGTPCARRKPTANTSSAMPTKATAAHSPTA